MTTTAKYDWYGEIKTIALTPRNYGHRFQYDGVTYHVERDAHRNSRWNTYRVDWSNGGRLIPLVKLAATRKQAITDTLFQAITEEVESEMDITDTEATDATETYEPTAYVPATDWGVSFESGTDIKGEILHVTRWSQGRSIDEHPEHHGKQFPDVRAAWFYAVRVGLLKRDA